MVKLSRYLIAFSLVICLLLLAAPVSADPGLKVTGAKCTASVAPGQTITHRMTVGIGESDPAMDIFVDVKGFGQSLDGAYQELEVQDDTSPYSVREFITLDKRAFHLDPGESQEVTATISIPEDVGSGGGYALIYIHSKPTGEGSVGYVTAVDVPIALTISGTELIKTGEITDISVSPDKPIAVSTTFHNSGNYHYRAKNEVKLKDEAGNILATAATSPTGSSIIPPYSYQFKVSLSPEQELSPGKIYYVVSQVTLEDDTLLDTEEESFWVPLPGIDEASIVKVTVENEVPPLIDAVDKADSEVSFNDTGEVSGVVVIAKYKEEPSVPTISFSAPEDEGGTGTEAIKFIEVYVTGFSAGTANIKLHYTDAEISGFVEDSLTLSYWDGNIWQAADNISLDSATNVISGDIPVSALGGTAMGMGGTKIPAMKWSLIIEIACGAVAVILILLVYFFLIRRRRR